MRIKNLVILTCLFLAGGLGAQKLFTKKGLISFHSDAPLEKIEAVNNKATSVFDKESGAIQWAVLIKAFHFEKALMEEHFNENYMESSKFPKAFFKGKIMNPNAIDFSTVGEYEVNLTGELEIHGVKREITSSGLFTVSETEVKGNCQFVIKISDFGIEIPSVVADNIAKEVEIRVSAVYEALD